MLYKLNLDNVKICIVGRTKENPPWRHSGRKLQYNHLVVVISGTCVCHIEDKSYTLNSYDTIFIPANKFYSFETTSYCEYFFACFYSDYIEANENDMKICASTLKMPDTKFLLSESEHLKDNITLMPDCSHLNSKTYSNISMLFIKLQQLNSTCNYLDRLSIDVYFKEILLLLSKSLLFMEKSLKYPHLLEQMINYINENYTEQITVETLSEIFYVSKSHVCSLFSTNFNMTVSEYVNFIKLEHATELLSNSAMNVTQIAEYLGFSSLHYFSRVFKKFYGVSPAKYSVSIIDK